MCPPKIISEQLAVHGRRKHFYSGEATHKWHKNVQVLCHLGGSGRVPPGNFRYFRHSQIEFGALG